MSLLTTARSLARHRGESPLELRTALARAEARLAAATDTAARVPALQMQLSGAELLCEGLRLARDEALTIREAISDKASRCDEAEAAVVRLENEVLRLSAAVTAWKAHCDNLGAVTVPAAHRDIDPGDQATDPMGINVTTLRAAMREHGPVIPVMPIAMVPGDADPAGIPSPAVSQPQTAAP